MAWRINGDHTARAATVLQELLPMVNPSEDHRTLYVSEGAESGFCIEADRGKNFHSVSRSADLARACWRRPAAPVKGEPSKDGVLFRTLV